jgi:hypothetical protein
MSEDDSGATVTTLEQLALRALNFQRYIYRRAWGIYYALWAVAYIAFVVGGIIPFQNYFSPNFIWVPYLLIYGGGGWASGIASALIFKNASRIVSLRKAVGLHRPVRGRSDYLMWAWWLAFAIVAVSVFIFLPAVALPIYFAMLVGVEIFIYYTLQLSFPRQIPLEGKLALASYGFSVVLSFFATLLTSSFLLVDITWIVTIGIWMFCSIYALWQAPEELERLIR